MTCSSCGGQATGPLCVACKMMQRQEATQLHNDCTRRGADLEGADVCLECLGGDGDD